MKVVGTRGRLTTEALDQQTQDINKRSITPDTHKARVLMNKEDLKNQEILQQLLYGSREEILSQFYQELIQEELNFPEGGQLIDYPFYVDSYNYELHNTSRVLHFGINPHRQGLLEELENHNNSVIKKIQENSVVSELNRSVKSNQEQLIQQKMEKLQEYKEQSSRILTDIEKYIVGKAIDSLNTFNNKTVLVEVFERDTDGKIKNSLETHTVVLYKQEDKYLVIDPSNPTFSTILVGANDQIRVCFNSKLQIYKPLSEPGPEKGDWRDCVDIAVKLAFNLTINQTLPQIKLQNNNQLELCFETIDYESLKNISSVKEITNQQTVYKQLPNALEKYAWRIKQSSDVIEQKKITTIFKILNNAYAQIEDKLSKLDLYESQNSIDKNKSNFYKQACSPEEYKDVIVQSCNFIKTLYEETGVGEVQLLGMEFNNIESNYEDVL